ncbi:MAG: sugar ABC transporter permease [Deltaproteobacteria bacterium]|nr:sugar ABC transporter permease [Deltaproteobacteria bacterium]
MSEARSRRLAVPLTIGLATIANGLVITSHFREELEVLGGVRASLDARAALDHGRIGKDLTIVEERRSAKYPFLNKKLYVVNTSSAAREGSALRGTDDLDKARADRDSLARQRGKAVVERLPSGFRATVAKGERSAEVFDASPRPSPPSPLVPLAGTMIAAVLAFLALAKRPLPASIASAAVLAAGAFASAELTRSAATAAANAFLVANERVAPILTLSFLPIGVKLGALTMVTALVLGFLGTPRARQAFAALNEHRGAYLALAPAMIGLAVLVGIPFFFGIGMSLFHHDHGDFRFVGLKNFKDILGQEGLSFAPATLPYALVITLVWTASNVFLHLALGLALALLLKPMSSRVSKIYRVLLIVPWAVPSYLTALIWRSMFDPDVGVVNKILGLEGMSWMHSTLTAFAANLVTNVWLGVPFMMVVCLGALTSIPEDLYEAADVDGASRSQQFLHVTLPLLRPALLPSVILGSIWTFNKFEVIYLVSEGRPDGATDILVTEAYRWAFERGLAQGGAYGYAAAYSVVIFVVLLLYGWLTSRVASAAEEALR